MSQQIIKDLKSVLHNGKAPQVLTNCSDAMTQKEYNKRRKIFNLRFDPTPAYIVLCENEAQVAQAVKVANHYQLTLRVRAGGHDHEGESTANGALVIDFHKMKKWEMVTREAQQDKVLVSLEPGLRFMDFVKKMAAYRGEQPNPGRIVPRGTCESVGVAGFSMGGGWGPWTRRHGMCCEYLVEANVVLGDGTIEVINSKNKPELLWALRGGGGFSYGIVTKFIFATQPAPKVAIRFKMDWHNTPALQVLERWEQITNPNFSDPNICTGGNPKLVGTNLKIDGIPKDDKSYDKSIHQCTFFGYYWGSSTTFEEMRQELDKDLQQWFSGGLYEAAVIDIPKGIEQNDKVSFSSWERTATKVSNKGGVLKMDFKPDDDLPAPHKLTSRLAKPLGKTKNDWGAEGRKNLILSLRSPLISEKGKKEGIHTYVTLGAIWGNYYKDKPNSLDYVDGVAFPYRNRPYTIQYQCWWNLQPSKKEQQSGSHVRFKHPYVRLYINNALDWIDTCRERDFPQTEGAFISFKDSSVPTKNYFLDHFEALRKIKKEYSKDKFNRFHSRKTIL